MRFLTRHQFQEKVDEELIAKALDCNVNNEAYSVYKDNNNDEHDIQQLLEEKKELLQVIGTAPRYPVQA